MVIFNPRLVIHRNPQETVLNFYILLCKLLYSILVTVNPDVECFVDNTVLTQKFIFPQTLYYKTNITLKDILSWSNNNFFII